MCNWSHVIRIFRAIYNYIKNMAISKVYIPATPRSKAFKYYTSSASGGGGGGTTSIIQQPNTSVTPGVAINKIGTGTVVVDIAENAEDESVLDVTMGTRMSSLATSGSGNVVTGLAYNTSTGVLTQSLGSAGSDIVKWRYVITENITLESYNYAIFPISTSIFYLSGVALTLILPYPKILPVSTMVHISTGGGDMVCKNSKCKCRSSNNSCKFYFIGVMLVILVI